MPPLAEAIAVRRLKSDQVIYCAVVKIPVKTKIYRSAIFKKQAIGSAIDDGIVAPDHVRTWVAIHSILMVDAVIRVDVLDGAVLHSYVAGQAVKPYVNTSHSTMIE